MPNLVRSMLLLAGATTLVAARVYAASDSLVIVVGNGPLAGTYEAPAGEIICVREKPPAYPNPGYGVEWRRFNGYSAKVLGEAAIEVSNPDKPGAKYGTVTIEFGDPDHNPTEYRVFPATLTIALIGRGGTIAFDGRTQEGIQLHVTASCVEWESMG
jgi:hypothetical protein